MNNNELVPAHIQSLMVQDHEQAVKQAIQEVNRSKSDFNLALAYLIYEVKENKYFQDWSDSERFDTLEEWSYAVLDRGRAFTYAMMKVYEVFVVEYEIDIARLKGIGWGKLNAIAPHVNDDNLESWLLAAENNSMAAIRAMIQAMNQSQPTDDHTKTFKFKVNELQAETVDSALEVAQDLCNSDIPGHHLEYICADFLVGALLEDKASHLDRCIKSIESAFGIKLTVEYENVIESNTATL